MLALCVAVCVALLIAAPSTTSTFTDGLYTSNGTDILRVTGSDVISVHKSASGRIVGLAYSHSDDYMFWSDISLVNRGIYRATVDSSGILGQPTKIVSDVLEVNGLTVDWVSSHIYWTDGRRRSVEVADFDGSNRRILITERLSQPRGIYADPTNGYLFWNDQGYHQIERSRLDGSDRQILVRNNTDIYWPNQMTVAGSKLYWVDSKYKTLDSVSSSDGSGRRSVSLGDVVGTGHVYGLAVFDNKAYISGWKSNVSMIEVQLPDGAPAVYQSGLSSGPVFSNAHVSRSLQPQPSAKPCDGKSCVLCLPISASTSRCSCPSYGGKVLNAANQCVEPSNVVLYTLAESGYVGFYDPAAAKNGDLYFVARSLRPVGVAYDPVAKYVYWSDVRERTIRRVKLDGSSAAVLLDSSKGIGVVDGLALDHVNRRLYYTNIGSMTVENEEYSWHKVETVRIDPLLPIKVRTIVSSYADRPRAIAIDSSNGYLYYTDWGKTASVVRSRLDGTSPTVLKMGLNNPNGIAVTSNKIYVTDSNYKTRVPANARTSMDGSLYSMNLDGSGWTDVLSSKLKTPFGLTAVSGQKLYVSDWDEKAIFEVDVSSSTATATKVISDVGLPMSVKYSAVSVSRSSDRCLSSSCDVCLPRGSSTTCTCNSYQNHRFSSNTCTEPGSYLLVADMDGVKMVSVDGSDEKSVYVAAVGRPFLSNLVALAYDSASKVAYYSDVARKAIYALTLSNSSSTEFYRVNHIIDGLTLHNGKLYWTDASNGLIASLDISSPKQHEVLKTGLDKPRAIVVTDSHIYWTEWGSKPRVARMSVSSSSSDETISSNHKWPNALFVKGRMLYIAESHPTQRRLVKCSTTDVSNCQTISQVNSAIVEHMYDIWVSNKDLLIYTDWKHKSVNMLSLTTGTLLRPLATGLMRPSQLLFVGTDSRSSCTSGHGCSDDCSPLFGSQQCVCNADRQLNGSTSTCVDESALSCTYQGKSYGVGTTDIKKSECVNCQCLPQTLFSSTDGLICHAIQCPVPDCQNPSVPAGQCCPVCGVCDGGVEITNCPSGDIVRVPLPANRDDVLYRFVPTTRDCSDQGRTITTTKTPRGNIYQWNGDEAHDVSVTATAGGSSATCDFKVLPVDTTRPTIRCPDDVLVYTEADKTTVDFPAPLVSDNVGVEPDQVTSSPARGSEFTVDTTPVVYTATDRAGLQSSCSFNVQVLRQSSSCVVPHLQRGHLRCSSASSSFTCVTECDSSYSLKPRTAVRQITCSGGQWSPQIPDDFEHFTCVKTVAGTVQGSISVTAGNVCSRDGGQLHTDYTEEVLEYRIEVNYLTYSLNDLSTDVTVSDCDSGRRRRRGANDVIVTVTIVGVYESESNRETVRQEIEYILQEIQKDLLRGFLVVPLRNDNGIWTAAIVTAEGDVNIEVGGCPGGSYKDETARICILCPAATHLSGSECVPCEKGTYNDRDGQAACTACPHGKSDSPAGSDSVDQCVPGGGLSTMVIIIIVVVIVVVIILIVVIVVVVLCVRKRRASRPDRTDHKYSNQAFDENNYATIDENYEAMAPKEPDHQYSSISEKTQ